VGWLSRVLCISFLGAVPTAELEPFSETYVQADEVRPASFLAKVSRAQPLLLLARMATERLIWA